MRRHRSSGRKATTFLALFTTVIVILGVTGVAVLTSLRSTAPSSSSRGLIAPTSTTTVASEPELLLVNDSGMTALSLDGRTEHMTSAEFAARVPAPFRPVEGADAANGSPRVFSLDKGSKQPREYVSPDRRYVARMGQPKSDGASVIETWQPNEKPQQTALRVGSLAVREAILFGWGDSKTLLISALSKGVHAVFSVSLGGSVSQLAPLPDTTIWAEGRGAEVWYVTAQPGEGIESDPKPPSELHRVTLKGDDLVVRDDQRVFMSVVSGKDGRIAYRMDDGVAAFMRIGDVSSRAILDKRQPILFLDDGRLVVRDGFDLWVMDPATGAITKIGTLPEGNVDAYLMPIRLDELRTSQ